MEYMTLTMNDSHMASIAQILEKNKNYLPTSNINGAGRPLEVAS